MDVLKYFGDKIIVINQKNLGQATARNVGIQHASGDLIALLDADDIWLPNKIESQVLLISESVQLVYCGIHFVNSQANVISKTTYPRYRNECRRFFESEPWSAIVVGGESTALFSKELYEKVGGFNNKLSTSSGWDFFRKCAAQTHFDFTNEVQVLYRQHDRNMSRDRKLIYLNMVKSGGFCLRDLLRTGRFAATFKFFCRAMWILLKTLMRDQYALKADKIIVVQ